MKMLKAYFYHFHRARLMSDCIILFQRFYAFTDYVLSNGQERRECSLPGHLATFLLFHFQFYLSQEIFKNKKKERKKSSSDILNSFLCFRKARSCDPRTSHRVPEVLPFAFINSAQRAKLNFCFSIFLSLSSLAFQSLCNHIA